MEMTAGIIRGIREQFGRAKKNSMERDNEGMIGWE